MRRLAALLLVLAACAHAPAPAPPAPSLSRDAARLFEQVEAEGATAGVLVVDLATGEPLFARREGTRLLPASTMKVATTAAALAALGSDHRYRTEVRLVGEQKGPVFTGDLVVLASGDPSLGSERWPETRAQALTDRIVQAFAERGIEEWRGELVVSGAQATAAAQFGPGWAWDDMVWDYSAAPEPFVWAENALSLVAERTGAGCGEASVRFEPPTPFLRAAVQEVVQDGRPSFACVRQDASFSCTWRHGQAECPRTARLSVSTGGSSARFELALDGALGRAKVQRAQTIRMPGESGARAVTGAQSELLLAFESPPLAELVKATNKESLNLYAERLALTLTRRATGSEDYEALRRVLAADQKARGIAERDLVQVDGSGLSRYNQATARALVQLLVSSAQAPYWSALEESLPVVGLDGTLARRKLCDAAQGKVRAKSGTLSSQRAFVGVADRPQDPAHPRVAFALLLGNVVQPSLSASEVFDRFAEMLVTLPVR